MCGDMCRDVCGGCVCVCVGGDSCGGCVCVWGGDVCVCVWGGGGGDSCGGCVCVCVGGGTRVGDVGRGCVRGGGTWVSSDPPQIQ